MPQVRLYQGGAIPLQGDTGARLKAVDNGPGIAATALTEGGKALSEYDKNQTAISDIVDEAGAKHLYNAYIQHSDQVLHSGDNAFYTLTGKAALDARPEVETSLQQARDALLAETHNPLQHKMLSDALESRVEEDLKGVGSHAIVQGVRFNTDESQARVTTLAADAGRNPFDPAITEQNIAAGLGEIDHLSGLQGWGPDQKAAARLKFTSGVRRDIGVRLAYEGQQGPDVALAYGEKFKDQLAPDDAAAIEDHARTQRNALAAEQRRQEAEVRRQDAETARAAGERAADTERMISQGIPVPANAVAQSLSDARTAGRPGLEASIRTGAFKNNLTVQYRDHTPDEIQARLNELGPRIKAAADHPKPEDVIEFDHLSTLRDKSASDLHRDPVSWGAAHLGVQVHPLNWSDPGSINARVRAATTISQRTGAPLRPLTEDEAARESPIAAAGSVQDRSGLISRLASLGAGSMAAAEQVAPNDDAFQRLVGLATSSNRSVARGYVAQALAGTEVLKRNPKAVDTDQARVRFNNYAGGAFRLLPTASNGIFTNAKNITAAWADQHGHTDWKSDPAIAGQFEGAVDAALGAYHRDGVKYGGLGIWRGERIVLPDGMSQQDFDTRLSRASKDQLLRASNGEPVWANGHPLQVREVANSQFVAVGDGVYRLTDGHGYVQKKGGGFYEIDVRRVR